MEFIKELRARGFDGTFTKSWRSNKVKSVKATRSKRRSCMIGCLGFVVFFTVLGVVVNLFSDSTSTTEDVETTPETITARFC